MYLYTMPNYSYPEYAKRQREKSRKSDKKLIRKVVDRLRSVKKMKASRRRRSSERKSSKSEDKKSDHKKLLHDVVDELKTLRTAQNHESIFGDPWDDSGILEHYKHEPIPPPFAKGGRYRKTRKNIKR